MPIQIGTSSTNATTAQLADLAAVSRTDAQTLRNFGVSLMPHKYTGAPFAITVNATGIAGVLPTPVVPADACAMEFWSNATGPTDYGFIATRVGQLGAGIDLPTNISLNIGATGTLPNRFVKSGEQLIMPFETLGVIPTTWRVARGSTGINLSGRFLSTAAAFPYLMAGAEESLLIGINTVLQFPTGTAAKFPVGTTGVMFQAINGTGTATLLRVTTDGTDPTSTLGVNVNAGQYVVDAARHGTALSALKFYVPSGWFIVAYPLKAA